MTLRSLLFVAETSMGTENGKVNHKRVAIYSKYLGVFCEKSENKKRVCGEERQLKMVITGKKFETKNFQVGVLESSL